MGPTKTPGPDGLSTLFNKRHRCLIKHAVCKERKEILEGKFFLDDFNETVLVLIPKVKSREFYSQFCPINLCNIIYKLVTN